MSVADNPLLPFERWIGPDGTPPLDQARAEHFPPAFDAALAEAERAAEATAVNPEPPSVANTIIALDHDATALHHVASLFFNLVSTDGDAAMIAYEGEIAARLAAFNAKVMTDPRIFARIDALWTNRDALEPQDRRVVELYRKDYIHAGAQLNEAERGRMGEIMARLAKLGAAFSRNVQSEEAAWSLALETEDDLAGLSPQLRDAAAAAAEERGLTGWAITLSRSLIEPFLATSTRRDLREKAYRAWTERGMSGERDNRAHMAEMLALRAERARLLGFADFASFKLANEMAKTPEAARTLLMRVWRPARAQAQTEASALQEQIQAEGGNFALAPWDWRFYTERRRKVAFDFDEDAIKPFLPLEKVRAAAFETARRLFGVTVEPLPDAPRHHPDVLVWRVWRGDRALGLFLGDYFARPTKRSGAWCSQYRRQHRGGGGAGARDVRPIVQNVMNFAKAKPGEPTLLSFTDAETLFHEFGHALHGLLSDVDHARVAGLSVARDFVELPSQLFEHWLRTPEILAEFARHCRTGEPMPTTLRDKLLATRTFNQGFKTVEYTASALVDLALHTGEPPADPVAVEAATLAEIGMPAEIGMRHRSAHFLHVFAGDGYSAGYYSYLWSEVMDADAFDAFEAAGDLFDAGTAERLYRHVYAAGASHPPEEAYRAFRGADPSPDALLRRRGLRVEA